jgi:hypothetical protein
VQIKVIGDNATPNELREALTHIAREAARQPHALGWGCPTRWDGLHRMLDELLDRLVGR